jgi:hypothetical protein
MYQQASFFTTAVPVVFGGKEVIHVEKDATG